MTNQQAWFQAVGWWGKDGIARFIGYRCSVGCGRYVVGLRKPDGTMEQYGTSRKSFDAAFENARVFGHGPKEQAA